MLNEVLAYLNNYFTEPSKAQGLDIYYQFSRVVTFTATDTLAGDFEDTFIAGEYIRIMGSKLNDGVYLISSVSDTEITIDATLDVTISTEGAISVAIYKCFIPKALVAVIADIKTYEATASQGIKRETQGKVSIEYAGYDNSWLEAYGRKLAPYKRLGW